MVAQVVTESSSKKSGHGCIWTLLFGVFYWMWLLFKWMMKYLIAAIFFMFVALYALIKSLVTKTEYRMPLWFTRMLQRRGTTLSWHSTVFVCQDCGNRQRG